MQLVLKRDWYVVDADLDGRDQWVVIKAGTYEVKRIPNPQNTAWPDWIVLVGTKIGAAINFWEQYFPGQICRDPFSPNFNQEIDFGLETVVLVS